MKMLLDLGNTRLKWSLVETCGVGEEMRAWAWGRDLASVLRRDWFALPRPDSVWAASVVDAARQHTVARVVRDCYGLDIHWVETPAAGCGVTVAYRDAARMGVDRFLGLVGARAAGYAPCALVSCGTALVLDAMDRDGRHLGGLIAPGARLMEQAVPRATARVRPHAPGRMTDLAASTEDALTSGSWLACAALTDRFIRRLRKRLGERCVMLLGGGDANILEPLLEEPVTRFPDAVLKGLKIWAYRGDVANLRVVRA